MARGVGAMREGARSIDSTASGDGEASGDWDGDDDGRCDCVVVLSSMDLDGHVEIFRASADTESSASHLSNIPNGCLDITSMSRMDKLSSGDDSGKSAIGEAEWDTSPCSSCGIMTTPAPGLMYLERLLARLPNTFGAGDIGSGVLRLLSWSSFVMAPIES